MSTSILSILERKLGCNNTRKYMIRLIGYHCLSMLATHMRPGENAGPDLIVVFGVTTAVNQYCCHCDVVPLNNAGKTQIAKQSASVAWVQVELIVNASVDTNRPVGH